MKKPTAESNQKRSESLRRYYGSAAGQETRQRMSEKRKGRVFSETHLANLRKTAQTEEYKAKHRKQMLENNPMNNMESRKKISVKLKGHIVSEETRQKMREKRLGFEVSDETKAKISASEKGRIFSDVHRQRLKDALNTPESKAKRSAIMKNRYFSPEHRANLSKSAIAVWERPGHAKKVLGRRPKTSIEEIMDTILIDHNFTYDFTGDGTYMIGRKNPDFVHYSKNKLIEVWGNHYHRGQNPQDRIDFFKGRGWDCIVFWASELDDLDKIIRRLNEHELS